MNLNIKNNKNLSCNSFGVAHNEEEYPFLEEAKEISKEFELNEKGHYIENPTKDQVLQNLDADILHFSCHGYFDNKNPLESE